LGGIRGHQKLVFWAWCAAIDWLSNFISGALRVLPSYLRQLVKDWRLLDHVAISAV